ncbi:tRNA wybutosine-synthesizing protein 5-like isoform X2 [Anneissia japonica]|uniref:tRNA wybutosine-synthesizing protein 5-like isoform X2 n=1 Tax=Anneissia japonica TaxID=1529436 RepID=UPI0014256EE1|nr:tRNA wybutosine-synthesizing protein 5-like isoform X2 [Anneissia japonica]
MAKIRVCMYENVDEVVFKSSIYPKRLPAILKGIAIGHCKQKWNKEYLKKVIGKNEVKVHVCKTPQMDFIRKNFIYKTLTFDDFIERASSEKHHEYFLSEDEKYYLRSLGEDPRKDVSNFHQLFPTLSNDLKEPKLFDSESFFSSVLRIGSPGVQLWTHYDVMDNILIQVNGRKRVVLFSPKDALNLYLVGDKSEVIDIDNPDYTKYPLFKNATWHECLLEPGDVLFIPALWFHNVTSLDFGVAVNVFWRHLDPSAYDHKDVYGNKDPLAATRAIQIADRAIKTLHELPDDYRDFYARRIIGKIQSKACSQF